MSQSEHKQSSNVFTAAKFGITGGSQPLPPRDKLRKIFRFPDTDEQTSKEMVRCQRTTKEQTSGE